MLLEAKSLRYAYEETPVIQNVSLALRAGETLGLVGPNGSGKSTLVKLLSGLFPPASGTIWLEGRPLSDYSRREIARRVAVLPQDPLALVDLTVQQVVRMGRFPFENWAGRESRDVTPLVNEVVRQTGIGPLLNRPFHTLSGGERQRVSIAKAMVQEPRLLLLDEPVSFLDIAYQVQMLKIIRKWQRECGLGVIMVLHDLNLAAHVCDRLLVLCRGEVEAEGTPPEVLTPQTIFKVYGVRVQVTAHPVTGVPQVWMDEWDHAEVSERSRMT